MFVNSQLVCLPPDQLGIFENVYFSLYYFFQQFIVSSVSSPDENLMLVEHMLEENILFYIKE